MGSVYEAEHLVLGTRVAVKILHPELARRDGLMERFVQEAMVAARIRSENVARVLDVERTPDGVAFMVLELLEGESLADVLDRQRRLEAPVACEYTRQILLALEAAHALGVVHRDLKPENVFVTYTADRPVLKLIDFGIAKLRREGVGGRNLTVAGVLMGTAEYMAPEQAYSADAVDARADLYAVGVMLYEMLAGARPVSGDDGRVVALKVERGEVVPLVRAVPGVKPELAGLVHRAMAFRRELRFASAAEMRIALEVASESRAGSLTAHRLAELEAKAGTGTLMGEPLPLPPGPAPAPRGTAVAPALEASGHAGHAQHAQTVHGAPGHAGTVHGAPAHVGSVRPSHGPDGFYPQPTLRRTEAPRRSSRLVLGLVVGSLLLGAGLAAAFVVSSSSGSTVPVTPVAPWPSLPPLGVLPPLPSVGPTVDPVAPLNTPPLGNIPPLHVPPGPAPPPRASGGPAPSAPAPSAPPVPSLGIPPFPSALPSFQLPTAWPSAPFPIPGFPSPPGPPSSGPPGY